MLSIEKLKSLTKQSFSTLVDRRYHHISNNLAKKALNEIEKDRGILDSKIKKRADEYAIEILGWKGFSPWLHTYSAINGRFLEGWIPDNYYGKIVIPKIQGAYGKISFLKPLCNRLLNIEASPEIASYINGFWFDNNLQPISKLLVKDVIFKHTNQVICKLDQSYQGRGIFQIEKKDFDISLIEKKGNCVIQGYIEQHSFFDEFIPDSVATIRITTVIDNQNKISVRASYLRLGRLNETHVKSVSHVRVPIDSTNGTLKDMGYLANWQTTTIHPDSKVTFLSKTIPQYQESVNLVLNLHERMPMVRSIGWDIIINNDNKPVLMEWNGYSNDIKFSEATQGPSFTGLGWENLHKAE
ncbi:sugar-transfer associated ATP-grasp domain-containing protein [Zobellia nedashkovskayae]|uniref:sugar-transfer associated ATP-grasp domain-containing protein n=1 Tax=Zobellia nedashkovskayae TaxID=2779510 RepID=UPI00188D0A01|nr:sugar-transfer associated ATP-grasp domain-containing protein [Zobellia nedashkovskayae]